MSANRLSPKERVRIPRQPPKGLQKRQVGLTRAKLLDALPAGDAHGAARNGTDERIHDRGLADPGFATHEPDSPLSLPRGPKPP